MIVLRKPFAIFDVDLVGAVLLVSLLAASWLFVFAPLRENQRVYSGLTGRLVRANEQVQVVRTRLADVEQQTLVLRQGVRTHAADAPRVGAVAAFIEVVASAAESSGILIEEVAPEPSVTAESFRTSDIAYAARGTSLDFLRLLDTIARDHPYHVLVDFSLRKVAGDGQAVCVFKWTFRLFHMADDHEPRAGERS